MIDHSVEAAIARIEDSLGSIFQQHGFEPEISSYPNLLWRNNNDRFVVFRYERTVYSKQNYLRNDVRVGSGIFDDGNALTHGVDLTDVLDFFEEVRDIEKVDGYPNEQVRVLRRRADYLPVIGDELFRSATIFDEIKAWCAATNRGSNWHWDTRPLLSMREMFLANGVAQTRFDQLLETARCNAEASKRGPHSWWPLPEKF